MICAYDKLYLEKARVTLACMLDYAVNALKIDLNDFYQMFLSSEIAKRFEKGDCAIIAGKSGVELTYEILDSSGFKYEFVPMVSTMGRTEEYWTGWVLAYYQWNTAMSFRDIENYAPIHYVRAMYSPYHEMDIKQFVDKMNEMYMNSKPETNLKKRRRAAGLSQKELAELTGIPLRTIQQYEQRQKNINKASVEYIVKLSQTLSCEVEGLIEKVVK